MYYKLCVMGNPIEHSKSPWIHAQFSKQFNLAIDYTRIQPEMNSFMTAVNQFKEEKGHGFNVTLPFKQEAYKISSETSQRALLAKSVNTILCNSDGTLFGDNTDGIGLLNDITKNLTYSLHHKTMLMIGAGGAARGILEPLLSQSPNKLIIANRTIKNAQQLALEFKSYGNITGCGFEDIADLEVDVMIDATGFDSMLSFPDTLTLSKNNLCYDLKYSNTPTKFMLWAKTKGGNRITDGLGMLVEQAAEAFYLWTGKKPDTKSVITLAKQLFYSSQI